MKIIVRATLGLSLATVFGFVGLMSNPAFANDLGLDFLGLNAIEQQIANADLMSRHLETQSEVVSKRMSVRQAILTDVVDGRLTVDEGATLFAELNEADPAVKEIVRTHFSGDNAYDRAKQQVLRYMRVDLNPRFREFANKYEAEMSLKLASK